MLDYSELTWNPEQTRVGFEGFFVRELILANHFHQMSKIGG